MLQPVDSPSRAPLSIRLVHDPGNRLDVDRERQLRAPIGRESGSRTTIIARPKGVKVDWRQHSYDQMVDLEAKKARK